MQVSSSVNEGATTVKEFRAAHRATSPRSDEQLSESHQERLALLSALISPDEAPALLGNFTQRAWSRQLQWLDTSGLALYLFGSLCDQGQESLLPVTLQRRWEQNLQDNHRRMDQLAAEALEIHRAFQREGLRYATLKGFSLCPVSVPRLERRSQLDLDFLLAEDDANTAKDLLESQGYMLRAVSGRSWEFKKGENAAMTLRDLYKPLPYYSVELHLEYKASKQQLLPRLHWQQFQNIEMPVLHPVDLFLGQGLHLFKHICSEFFRVAHLYEFRRHVVLRSSDEAFWRQLRETAGDNARASVGLGVAVALITHLSGPFAPPSLTAWTSDCLSPGVQRWIDTFAMRVTLGSHPGSKLYLLLQPELEIRKVELRRSVRQSLIPKGLPPRIASARAEETFSERVHRNFRQISFIIFRLRFHLVEGARYLYYARRFRR